ncbi:MAG: hypothetical protein P8J20_09840 [Novosphingobium sp.]|nr:hypothetical protein [Novosphingobium sp.]
MTSDPELLGYYRLAEGPDVAGRLALTPDGKFRYALTAGALDEKAQGRWERKGPTICLFTEPRPVLPVFSEASVEASKGQDRTLLVAWPDGTGIAGVEFRLGFEDGSVIEDYTQYDGWTMPHGEDRKPIWIELAVPMHGLESPRIKLDDRDGEAWRFVLTPNDLGVADFQGACLKREENGYVLERKGGTMRFVRSAA